MLPDVVPLSLVRLGQLGGLGTEGELMLPSFYRCHRDGPGNRALISVKTSSQVVVCARLVSD
jgi:hypothetical protein